MEGRSGEECTLQGVEGRSEGGVYPPGGGGQECTLQGVEGRSVPSRGWRAGMYPPVGVDVLTLGAGRFPYQ